MTAVEFHVAQSPNHAGKTNEKLSDRHSINRYNTIHHARGLNTTGWGTRCGASFELERESVWIVGRGAAFFGSDPSLT